MLGESPLVKRGRAAVARWKETRPKLPKLPPDASLAIIVGTPLAVVFAGIIYAWLIALGFAPK